MSGLLKILFNVTAGYKIFLTPAPTKRQKKINLVCNQFAFCKCSAAVAAFIRATEGLIPYTIG
jgi:hypothetical protein